MTSCEEYPSVEGAAAHATVASSSSSSHSVNTTPEKKAEGSHGTDITSSPETNHPDYKEDGQEELEAGIYGREEAAVQETATTPPLQQEEEEEEGWCGREKLKRHRVEVAGRVWIPETWGQEELLKDWIDCSAFDAALVSNGIMSARDALAAQQGLTTRLRTPSPQGLSIGNSC